MSTEVIHPTEAPAEKVPAVERRRAERFPILQRCLVWPAGGPRGPEPWRCIAYNLSLTGVGVTMPFPPSSEMRLEIQPWDLPAARPLTVRVVRTTPVEFLWFCGCEMLSPLNDDELQAWLGGRPDAPNTSGEK